MMEHYYAIAIALILYHVETDMGAQLSCGEKLQYILTYVGMKQIMLLSKTGTRKAMRMMTASMFLRLPRI